MKLATPEQMNAVDACTIKEYGIPGLLLMENAASAVVSEVVASIGSLCNKRILILAGRGNNGGDAFACARLLYCKGIQISIYLLGSIKLPLEIKGFYTQPSL
jgi:NAD(P)H-hydrate epimerase